MKVLGLALLLAVQVHYYPEMIVFTTQGGNIGVTLNERATQLCSATSRENFECHLAIPRPTYKEIR